MPSSKCNNRGKENLQPIYDALSAYIVSLGEDIEMVPKKAFVSAPRKKQSACLKPATKARFELELILKVQEAQGILEPITGTGAMCTHNIKLSSFGRISDQVKHWIKERMKMRADPGFARRAVQARAGINLRIQQQLKPNRYQ
ncbi:MAG TPA: DUF5655 domain-containing protein [Chryseosolibacter sp.]